MGQLDGRDRLGGQTTVQAPLGGPHATQHHLPCRLQGRGCSGQWGGGEEYRDIAAQGSVSGRQLTGKLLAR